MTIKTSTQVLATASMALLLALSACHKDENPADPNTNGTPVPLCATASLPGAEGDATVTRTATATGTVRIQWDATATATPVPVSLTHTPSGGGAKSYSYTLAPDGASKTELALAPAAPDANDSKPIVIPGEQAALAIEEVILPLQTVATGGDATTRATRADADATASTPSVPFSACVKYPATTTPIGAGGSASLPLQYTTYALRLILHLQTDANGKPVLVNSVSCPLTMANPGGAASDKARKPTTTATGAAAPTQQTVIFGRLTPDQALAAGTLLAILNMADGNALSVSLPPASTITPKAGQMLTLNVYVSSTVASIGEVSISDFAPDNNKNGETITEGTTIVVDGLNAKDPLWFSCNKDNTDWIVKGGGTETISDPTDPNFGKTKDEVVLANVRTVLSRIQNTQDNDRIINLMLPDVVEISMAGENTGAFQLSIALLSVSAPKATRIRKYAFKSCSARTISLPRATTIEESAFDGYGSARTISLPQATSIGKYAFQKCSNLTSISLPLATSIGYGAFIECSYLTSISLPLAMDIERCAFQDCTALTSISLPLATDIGVCAFSGCSNLTSISLPKAMNIGKEAFLKCSKLTSISLPEAMDIGEYAFQDCEVLPSISLPEATSIGKYAFDNCFVLTSISLPKATRIGDRAFSDCRALTTLDIRSVTTADDATGLHNYVFMNFNNHEKCELFLNPVFDSTKYPDSSPTAKLIEGKWFFFYREWLSIEFPPTH